MMQAAQVRKQSTLEGAVEAIRTYIIGNRQNAGAVLPSEPALAAELGISRNILREALRHYRTLGIIESKPKIGTVVARLLPDNPYENYLPFLAAERVRVRPELAEMRYSLETGAARFMVRRAAESEIQALEEQGSQLEQCMDFKTLRQLDTDFHASLLRTAHNTFLDGMIPLLVDFFATLAAEQRGCPELALLRRVEREHRSILAALRRRDAELLRIELEKHIQSYLD